MKSIAPLLLLFATLPVSAAIYHWVDDNGKVVYSQTPPADGRTYQKVDTPPPQPTDVKATEKRLEEARKIITEGSEARKKQRHEEAKRASEEEMRRKNCETARNNLKTLTSRPPNTLFNVGDGQFRRFTPEELKKRVETFKQFIKENCD